MSVDLQRRLHELAGSPSHDFDVHAALRRARRRRAVGITGAATSVTAVAVAATMVLGGTGPSGPVILDVDDPDVAAPTEPPAPAEALGDDEVVGDGEFVIILTPATGNILADLEAQARDKALDRVIAGEPSPQWQDLTVDLGEVDSNLRPIVEQHHELLTASDRYGDRPIVPDDQRSLLEAMQRRVLQELPPTTPPFDIELLSGPENAGDRELAWYMADDGSGQFDDARIEQHLGPALDDVCGWLGDRHADADARFRDMAVSSGRFETSYGLPPLQIHEPLHALGHPPIGDGLVFWIDERCHNVFPDFEPWPDHASVGRTPPEPSNPEQPDADLSENVLAAAVAQKPEIMGEPREAGVGSGHIFGYADGREQPANQEGIAVFLTTGQFSDGDDDTGTLVPPFERWAQYDRLETQSDGWPPGTLAGIIGPAGDATQVVFHLDGTTVNLSADDPGANEILEGWARDIAWDLHDEDSVEQ